MRVIVIGGTRFIGRAVVAALTGAGHDVLLVHRGEHEPAGLPDVPHLHANRRALGDHRDRLTGFDALVDVCAMTGPDASALLDAVPGDPHLIVASSQDVYQAFSSLLAGRVTEPVPLDEDAALRDGPLEERRSRDDPDWDFDAAAYEKLDVERAYLARAGRSCGCRSPTASTTTSAARRRSCAGSGPGAPASPSGRAPCSGPRATPATSPRRSA
jgi:nucleoside-diphosphate-sugar epimerase